jgi:hypothetical protein
VATENNKNSRDDKSTSILQKSPKKSRRQTLSDRGAFTIAIAIFASYTILSFFILWNLNNIEYFKDVSSIYGAWIGIVIGYFFGSRKVEVLTEKIDNYMEFAEMTDNDWEQSYNTLFNEKQEIEILYSSSVKSLQYIVAKNPEICPELKENLKTEHGIII